MSLFILPLIGSENHTLVLGRARGRGGMIVHLYSCCLAGKYVQDIVPNIAAPQISVAECVQEETNMQNSDP